MDNSIDGDREIETTADDITQLRSPGAKCGTADETPRVLKQRFVLEDKLGSGGMGTVYRARDLRKVEARDKHPYVAIKVLNNDFRTHPDAFIALQREASKSQAIAHPNIVSIYDFDKDGDVPYMTMELLEGKDLAELLKQYPNGLPDALLWPALEGICAGLKRAHDAGIIHADFKPGNVIVTTGGVPKILDFGIARAIRTQQYEGESTVFDPAKLAALTPAYASREVLTGETPTARDDIYSFAVVAYLMLTGRHPYDRVRADEAQKQQREPERCKRLSARQWRVLERCLAFDGALRPASMDEVIARLLRPSPARPWLFGALALAVVVAGMLGWLGPPHVERREVARTAVAQAQTSRIEALLAAPAQDANWHGRVAEELAALAKIEAPDSVAALRQRALGIYLEQMKALDFDGAADLLERANAIAPSGRFEDGRALLEAKSRAAFDELLAKPRKDADWIAAVEAHVDRHRNAFFGESSSLRMQEDAGAAFRDAALQRIQAKDAARARSLIDAANRQVVDPHSLAPLEEQLEALESMAASAAAEAQRKEARRRVDAALATMTATPCASFTVAAVSADVAQLVRDVPLDAARIKSTMSAYAARCVGEVARLDYDRAIKMRDGARRAFGASSALDSVSPDACGVDALLGNGASVWHAGFCVDAFEDGAAGPRLVVVPVGDSRLAVAKFETSWHALAPFCRATGSCKVSDLDTPAMGISVDVAEGYAAWLSAGTHQRYRLPSLGEWRAFAEAGDPDPNRNCGKPVFLWWGGKSPVDVRAGSENSLGLVNALGNAREWVRDGEQLLVAGGSYRDAPSECVAEHVEKHDGRADPFTGFRVVREVR